MVRLALFFAFLSCAVAIQGSVQGISPKNPTCVQGSPVGCLCGRTPDPYDPSVPVEVSIGFYINRLSPLDVAQSQISIRGYMWLKWMPTFDLNGEEFRPDTTFEFSNVYYLVDFELNGLFGGIICDPFGSTSKMMQQHFSFEGTLVQKLDFQGFPLDSQNISIFVEDTVYPVNQLKYVPDDTKSTLTDVTSNISPELTLPGWTIGPFSVEENLHVYNTNFGSDSSSFAGIYYSRIVASFKLFRDPTMFSLKILPPIAITILISGFVFLLDIETFEIRLGTVISTLLTQVFLQIDNNSNLPLNADYLSLADAIFLLCYILIFLIIIECIYMRRLYYKWSNEERAAKRKKEEEEAATANSPIEEMDIAGEEKRKCTWWFHAHFSTKSYGGKDAKGQNETRTWIATLEDIFFGLFVIIAAASFAAISLSFKSKYGS